MKKFLFSCLSLALVMMLWAFTHKKINASPAKPTQTQEWFEYIGNGSSFSDPGDYEYRESQPGCTGDDEVCAIYVTGDGQSPELPDQPALTAIQGEIEDALEDGPTTNVKMKN